MRWLIAATIAALLALGGWQLQRRAEKLELIARVERRLQEPYVPAPGPASWAAIGPDTTFTRIYAVGRYRSDSDTRVQAVTRYGGGYWLLTPFDTGAFTLLINRGFVPAGYRQRVPPPQGMTTVRGLMRVSEPLGGFLQRNDPAAERWYSRDVAAIGARRGVIRPAPYFIDAEAGRDTVPRGGLTTVRFANNHLLYALTWFVCAGVLAWLAWRARRKTLI